MPQKVRHYLGHFLSVSSQGKVTYTSNIKESIVAHFEVNHNKDESGCFVFLMRLADVFYLYKAPCLAACGCSNYFTAVIGINYRGNLPNLPR